jgi:hypothetical protein
MSQPAPPPARSPEREGLLCHHPAPPIREVTVMVGRCHRTCRKSSSCCPRELTRPATTAVPAQCTPGSPCPPTVHQPSRMALPDPTVQRTARHEKIRVPVQCRQPPRLASDRPLPARRPVQNKFRACPASRFPRPGPGQGPAAGSVPVRAPQVIPGASSHDHDRHQLADSFPAAPGHRLQARPAQEHRPALAVDVGATECPDLGGSNHGAEGSDSAPDRRLGERSPAPVTPHAVCRCSPVPIADPARRSPPRTGARR